MNNLAEPISGTHSRENYEEWDRMATDMQNFPKTKGEIIRPTVKSAQEQNTIQPVMNKREKL